MIELLIASVLIAAFYGVVGYWTKHEEGEPFIFKKFVRTVLMYVVAALFVVAAGDPVTQGGIEAQLASIAILSPMFDHVWSKLERQGYIPEWTTKDLELAD